MMYDLLALAHPGEGWLVRHALWCDYDRMYIALEAGQYHA